MFFTVYYAEKGDKMLHHFQGKIDIGSGNGGIISQLKMQNEMKLTDESWISYQQGKGNARKRNRQSMNAWKSIRESSRKSREKISRREELIWV